MKRQSVRPGLSGLAQVNGRNGISWEEKFKFDLRYIEKVTLWRDIFLVLQTIFKSFVTRENVNRNGFDTDEDYGCHLLTAGIITADEYFKRCKLAETEIINYE